MQSQTRKSRLYKSKIIELRMSYRDTFWLCLRVSSGEKQNITIQVSKKSGKHSNGKFYKRISNYIKTCSTTPNTGKFARIKGWVKKRRCNVACEHTTGRFMTWLFVDLYLNWFFVDLYSYVLFFAWWDPWARSKRVAIAHSQLYS